MRAKAHIEDLRGGHSAIIVTELPYQVNKASLVERIADLVREGRIEGIADLRDESDRKGMRIVIELKRGVEAQPVLNNSAQVHPDADHLWREHAGPGGRRAARAPLKRILLYYIEHRAR